MTARDLTNELLSLLRKEQGAMADFLLALADFDRHQRWRELGHTSLFYFLRRELGLSAGAAQYRKTAAELIQKFTDVESALRAGKLCLSTIVDVAKVLTPENCAEMLPRFYGLSHREAELVTVSIKPVVAPPVRDVVTVVRTPPASAQVEAPSREPLLAPRPSPEQTDRVRTSEPMTLVKRDTAGPLNAEQARFHVTVSRRFLEKLDAAKDALSHAKPNASAEEILEAGLDLLLGRRAKRNGLVAKPRKEVRPSSSGRIPAHVKRAVWTRAGGRCEYILESGERCGYTTRLEYDHVVPKALGGEATVANTRLACRPHNDHAARLAFGDRLMDRYTRKRRRDPATSSRTGASPPRRACRGDAGARPR
jgi:hypothetical protein